MNKKFIVLTAFEIVFVALLIVWFLNIGGTKGIATPKQKPVTNERGWALGCAAMLMERNHSRHDVLAADDLTPRSVQINKKLLRDWWDVKNRAEFLDALVWLDEQGGHRKSFDEIGRLVSGMNDKEFKSALAACGSDMEKRQKVTVARQYYKMLGDKSIKGWDYTRYVAMCRWGYTAGYITENEAWTRIMPVARKLQKTFDSWEDLGKNYLIGRQFWSYSHTESSGDLFTAAFNQLMQKKDSPWNRYPWDMDLGSQQVEIDADK
jgi:hypothetical protein